MNQFRTFWASITGDEDMGQNKKSDDLGRPSKYLPGPGGGPWRPAAPRRSTLVKRVGYLLIAAVLVYLFVANLPKGSFRDRRHPSYAGDHKFGLSGALPGDWGVMGGIPPRHKGEFDAYRKAGEREGAKPADGAGRQEDSRPSTDSTLGKQEPYNGPVKLPFLLETLQAVSNAKYQQDTRNGRSSNKNVLYLASSTASASALLSIACAMGKERRSYVNFAFTGRGDIELDDLAKLSGVDDSCHIIFHDARVDQSMFSTESRLGQGIIDALRAINIYMRPETIFVAETDEPYFLQMVQKQTGKLGHNLILLPENAAKSLDWITKLDSGALTAWNRLSISIIIHAVPGTGGSLVRLLKSLAAADYSGHAIPHLTIELPDNIDDNTLSWLSHFQWPPGSHRGPNTPNQVSLRKRIPPRGINEEEAGVRFLESFWPLDSNHEHVLVLSPNAELSRNYYQYLKYALLEYRHSKAALLQGWDRRLLGISLELPTTLIDGKTPLEPPVPTTGRTTDKNSAFLWQAPTSNAILIAGDRWAELHAMVSRVIAFQRSHPDDAPLPEVVEKRQTPPTSPIWLEHVLRLAQARGYLTLYPSAPATAALGEIHTEVVRPPEEYEGPQTLDEEMKRADMPEEALANGGTLLEVLPASGMLLPLNELPLLKWNGESRTLREIDDDGKEYSVRFRTEVGGCTKEEARARKADKTANDLFCIKHNWFGKKSEQKQAAVGRGV